MLFVFTCVFFMLGSISADTCSLLYSYLGFVLSLLSYVGGYYMEVNVVVVIGFNMVGTKQHEILRAIRTIHGQSLKITNSGATPGPLPKDIE